MLILAQISSTTIALASTVSGAANLHQIRPTGNSGEDYVTDTGTTLTADGTAMGWVPGQSCFSLLGDVGSKPSGPHACEPSPQRQPDTRADGGWVLDDQRRRGGTLHAVKSGASYVALNRHT
jgi:hypothetical protein